MPEIDPRYFWMSKIGLCDTIVDDSVVLCDSISLVSGSRSLEMAKVSLAFPTL